MMKFDMHVHSTYSSDGQSSPETILRKAKKIGLAGLAITDHNTLKGNEHARKLDSDLLIVRGVEISSSEGHILAYGISEPVPKGIEPVDLIDNVHQQGGIAVIAHPFRPWSGVGEKVARSIAPDAIEVQNSHSTKTENFKARKLCQSMGLPATGGSDAHNARYLGKSYTIFEDVSTEDDVIEAIRTVSYTHLTLPTN